jgi:O-antigen/teichoic acid export membrane protein
MTDPEPAPIVSNKDVAKGAGTTLIARLGGVLDVVTQPLYVALFGLTGFGFYGAIWAAVNLVENVADLGMTSAMQRVVPQAKSPQEEVSALRAAFLLGMVPCILVAALVSTFAQPVAGFFNASSTDALIAVQAIRLFAWALPLWAFIEIATSALRSKRVFGAEIRLRLFWEQVVRLALVVALYMADFGTMALFVGHLASLTIICLLCVRMLNRYFDLRLIFQGPVRDAMFAETLKSGLGVLPVNIVTRLFGDGPAIALNAILPGAGGAAAAGLYIIARKISSLVQLVRTAFAYVLAPLASAASTGDDDSLRTIYGFATRLSLAIAVPLGTILAASGPAILPVFGPEAAAALIPLTLLVCARVIEAICGPATPIQQVTARHLDQQVGSLIGLVVASSIAWWGTGRYGVNAMAAAVASGLVIAAITPLFQLHLISRLHPFASPFGRVALRTLGITAIGFAGATVAGLLPHPADLVAEIAVLLVTIWLSLRFALPHEDRVAMGAKTARALRLV